MNSLMSTLMSASSLPNMNSASALASSVFPTPVGPRKMNEPIGRLGSFRPARARRTALETIPIASSWPMTRLVERLLHLEQALGLLLRDAGDRDAGPHRDDLGDLLLVDLRLLAADLPPATRCAAASTRSRGVASASRRFAASSYSCALIEASFSLVIRSSSFWASRSAGGADEWRRRTRLPASSIRSIALSGRWRSVM